MWQLTAIRFQIRIWPVLMMKSTPTLILLLIAVALVITLGLLIVGALLRVGKSASSLAVRRLVDMPADACARLSDRTIFFGHQSVGNNILDGIRDLRDSHGFLNLHINESKTAGQVNSAMLVHAPVGRNREPLSKIAEFREIMENGLGEKVDIAFLKFCYVDITRDTDPNTVLDAYCNAIEALKTRFPDVRFMYITVPLCAPPRTAKGILKMNVKRVFGRSTVLDDNLVRARYNALLRERFSGKEPLFDLAGYEALGPDGLRHFGLWKGQQIPILVELYTNDGGHLNEMGRQHIAEQLLIELLELSEAME